MGRRRPDWNQPHLHERHKRLILQSLGNRVTFARLQRGLAQDAVCGPIGRTKSWMSLIERDLCLPNLYGLLGLCRILNVSATWLLHGLPVHPWEHEWTNGGRDAS